MESNMLQGWENHLFEIPGVLKFPISLQELLNL